MGVTFDVAERVAIVTINRPQKMNAINQAVRDGLRDAFEKIDEDKDINVAVLRGAGEKAFSAGADLNEASEWTPFERRRVLKNSPAKVIQRCQKPVIAMITGYAIGGGLEMALGCDIRFAADDAVFGFPEVGLGWLPAGGGGTQLLPRTIGYGNAMWMILSADRIDANAAERMGLVQKTWPLEKLEVQTLEVARKISKHRGRALILAKAALQMAARAPLDAGLRYELELNTICNMFEDLDEGIRAFKENRTPQFDE